MSNKRVAKDFLKHHLPEYILDKVNLDSIAFYRHSTDIFQLFNEKQQALARAVLFKPFQLVDVTQVPDQELQQHEWASMMELIQKHIFARDFLNHLESIIPAIQFIDQHGDKPYLDTSLHYLLHRGNVEDINRFLEIIHDKIPAELEGDVMTIAELLIAKGHKEGRQHGLEEGLKKGQHLGLKQGALNTNKAIALKMYQAGIDMETIQKITNLNIAELI